MQAAECAPYIYQLYMALGICLSSWLVLAWEPFAFTWWGLPATVRRIPAQPTQPSGYTTTTTTSTTTSSSSTTTTSTTSTTTS